MKSQSETNEVVQWQLKYLITRASDMSSNDLEWTIKMEEAYKRFGKLTDRQRTVLESIYKRY